MWPFNLHRKLDRILDLLEKIAMTDQDILDKVTAQQTVIDSVVALLKQLSDLIKNAGTDPVKLQAISDMLDTQDKALADAVTANTPPG